MSHITIIIDGKPTNPPDAEERAVHEASTAASITYTPSDQATPEQIGDEVAKYVKRVRRIVDGGGGGDSDA